MRTRTPERACVVGTKQQLGTQSESQLVIGTAPHAQTEGAFLKESERQHSACINTMRRTCLESPTALRGILTAVGSESGPCAGARGSALGCWRVCASSCRCPSLARAMQTQPGPGPAMGIALGWSGLVRMQGRPGMEEHSPEHQWHGRWDALPCTRDHRTSSPASTEAQQGPCAWVQGAPRAQTAH